MSVFSATKKRRKKETKIQLEINKKKRKKVNNNYLFDPNIIHYYYFPLLFNRTDSGISNYNSHLFK